MFLSNAKAPCYEHGAFKTSISYQKTSTMTLSRTTPGVKALGACGLDLSCGGAGEGRVQRVEAVTR